MAVEGFSWEKAAGEVRRAADRMREEITLGMEAEIGEPRTRTSESRRRCVRGKARRGFLCGIHVRAAAKIPESAGKCPRDGRGNSVASQKSLKAKMLWNSQAPYIRVGARLELCALSTVRECIGFDRFPVISYTALVRQRGVPLSVVVGRSPAPACPDGSGQDGGNRGAAGMGRQPRKAE